MLHGKRPLVKEGSLPPKKDGNEQQRDSARQRAAGNVSSCSSSRFWSDAPRAARPQPGGPRGGRSATCLGGCTVAKKKKVAKKKVAKKKVAKKAKKARKKKAR